MADHARVIELPGPRLLLQAGRSLRGWYFLLRGELEVRANGRDHRLCAGSPLARAAFFPGATRVFAPRAVQLLQIEVAPLRGLLESEATQRGVPALCSEPWLNRFLGTPVLARLPAARWQALLRQMALRPGTGGETLLHQGEPGRYSYLLREGRAIVHRGSCVLRTLRPGDLFGADAPISGAPRNASVTLRGDGLLMRLPERALLELLVEQAVVVAPGPPPAHARTLRVAAHPIAGAVLLADLRRYLPTLATDRSYAVLGGTLRERLLAAFLLQQQGLRAIVIRPGPCAPAPTAVAARYSRRA